MDTPRVVVTCKKAGKSVDYRTIRRRAERLLSYLGYPRAELSILLCDDTFIRELNREYRSKNRPTDVLSFAMSEGESLVGGSELLGDIVISTETASRQAPLMGHTTTAEVTSLLIHGLLHLLGYDHQKSGEEKIMQKKAWELESWLNRRR